MKAQSHADVPLLQGGTQGLSSLTQCLRQSVWMPLTGLQVKKRGSRGYPAAALTLPLPSQPRDPRPDEFSRALALTAQCPVEDTP